MRWIEGNGVSLRVDDDAAAGEAAPLVLLHELGGSLESFDGFVGHLAGRRRVVRYDQRGAGLSEKQPGPVSLDEHARDLDALLRALGLHGPCHLVGVAAGAAVAALLALAQPERAASLALCAPALGVAPDRRQYLLDRARQAAERGMRGVAEPTLVRSYPEILRGDRAAFEGYRARFLANDPAAYARANEALANAAVEARLEALDAPCLVLAGVHDPLRPPDQVRRLADRIPGARFAVIESGHLMPVQAPAAMAAAVEALIEGLA